MLKAALNTTHSLTHSYKEARQIVQGSTPVVGKSYAGAVTNTKPDGQWPCAHMGWCHVYYRYCHSNCCRYCVLSLLILILNREDARVSVARSHWLKYYEMRGRAGSIYTIDSTCLKYMPLTISSPDWLTSAELKILLSHQNTYTKYCFVTMLTQWALTLCWHHWKNFYQS